MKPRSKAPRTTTAPQVESAPIRWSWRRDGLITGVICAVALAGFANSLGNGYVYDDVTMIRDNPRLGSPWNLREFFGTSYWGQAKDDARLYRPLTVMSFAIDRALFGPGPVGVHAMNVLANAVIGGLVYILLFRLLGRRDIALAAALLFILHPVHTEVVANGVGRSELYAAVAMLLAVLLHLEYALKRGARIPHEVTAGVKPAREAPRVGRDATARGDRARMYGGEQPGAKRSRKTHAGRGQNSTDARVGAAACLLGAIALYFTSLLFKESAAVLPAILIVMEWIILERGNFRPLLSRPGRFLVYVLPLAVYLAMRISVVGAAAPAVQEVMAGATGAQRFVHASETMIRYLGQLVFPFWLCAEYGDYTRLIASSWLQPLALVSVLAWPAWASLLFWLYRRGERALLFSAAWFLLTILPVSNLIVRIGTIRADRLLFVPSLGFALAVAVVMLRPQARAPRVVGYALLGLVLAFYGWRTVTRNADWRSPESLWAATVRQNPGSAVAWAFVGDIHRANHEFAEAQAAYQRSFELRDGAGFFYPESHNNYAQMCVERGDRETAEQHYRLVISKQPRQYVALLNLGELLLHQAATRGEAIELLKRAIAQKPDDFRGHVNLAQAYKFGGQFSPALDAINDAIRLDPKEADFWSIKAEILGSLGRAAEAQSAREQAARRRPP